MSSRPIEQPLMHPEALWDLAAIKCYANTLSIDGELHVERDGFPRSYRLTGRGHRRWRAGDVMDYFANPPPVAGATEPDHVLYRQFSADGELLYVGISLSALSRLRGHRHRSSWFRRVARIELEHFNTRHEALAAEAKAIRVERPRYNKV